MLIFSVHRQESRIPSQDQGDNEGERRNMEKDANEKHTREEEHRKMEKDKERKKMWWA